MQDCVGYLGTALHLTRPAQICSSVSDRQGTEMLEAQSILVTGSNRGIGLEIVRQLVGRISPPQWIFATCREPEGPRAQELKNLLAMHQGVEIIQMDVADPSSIKAAAVKVTEKLQGAGLNLLINNAAIVKPNSLELESPEGMSDVYNTNVIGPMLVSQAFLPLLRKASQESPQKGMSCSKAAIVNMSSDAGSITNVLGWEFGQAINYRCSKAALNMLTRCQALEFAKDNILCIALHPGWVQTDMGNLVIPAPMALDTNVGAILNTLGRLTEKDNGTFVNWEGEVRPW